MGFKDKAALERSISRHMPRQCKQVFKLRQGCEAFRAPANFKDYKAFRAPANKRDPGPSMCPEVEVSGTREGQKRSLLGCFHRAALSSNVGDCFVKEDLIGRMVNEDNPRARPGGLDPGACFSQNPSKSEINVNKCNVGACSACQETSSMHQKWRFAKHTKYTEHNEKCDF